MNKKIELQIMEVLNTFAQYGYRKTSMANLGNAFGISRQALYKRFCSKELVFNWLVSQINDLALSGMKNALADNSMPMVERLLQGFDCWTGRYVDILRSAPHAMEIMDHGVSVAKNDLIDGSTVADKIRMLIARELVIEGIVPDLTEGERFAFTIYMASKGLTLSAPSRLNYLEKMRWIIQTVID